MTNRRANGLGTLAVHLGHGDGPALDRPLVLSSAFHLGTADEAAAAFRGESDAPVYGRWGNPTVQGLEELVAGLEGAEDASVAASGMAAISGALLTVLGAGDHVVAPRALYGETARLLREKLPRLGIRTTFLDDTSPEAFRAAIEPTTRVVYLETPSNPTLALLDIEAIAKLAHESDIAPGILVFVDNTFATPYCQRPLSLGADLVLHSMTKFLCGHGDAIAGCAVGPRALVGRVRETTIKNFGGALAPFSALLVARGIRTFALRLERATRTAATLAERFTTLGPVNHVYYPGLSSDPGHALAKRQMSHFPAIFSFSFAGGLEPAKRFVESVELATHAVSLGDVRTLVTHPASTTASTMPAADRARIGIGDGLVRVAVGIEDLDDLWDDLRSTVEKAGAS
jgi:methionine-gamma-lyase